MCGSYPYRTLLVIGAFLFALSLSKAQPPNWDSVYTHYLQKYQPTDTPSWLFPMVFEEAGGQQDTIYLGYDSLADDIIDTPETQFGERWGIVDSSNFQVMTLYKNFNNNDTIDSMMQVDVRGTLDWDFNIEFNNGYLPLKVWWDVKRFHSDSMPFTDQNPAPRGEGILWPNAYVPSYEDTTQYCGFTEPVLLSDSCNDSGGCDCMFVDSLNVSDYLCNGCRPPDMTFEVRSWTGKVPSSGIANNSPPASFQVYPNPVDQLLMMKADMFFKYQLFNIKGQIVRESIQEKQTHNINTGQLFEGLYLLKIPTPEKQFTQSIMIVH